MRLTVPVLRSNADALHRARDTPLFVIAGLTRQSILLSKKLMDTRVEPAYDA
jgi:hypothetical protein